MSTADAKYHVEPDQAVEQYADMVYRIALTVTGNVEDAKDVFQETFLRLIKYQNTIQNDEHLKAWLIRVVGNCAKTYVSNSWNRKTQGLNDQEVYYEPEYELETNQLFVELHKLPQKYSMVLYLYYYEEYSIKEISLLLEKKENSIKTLLSRGRDLLKKRLEEGGEIDA